VPFGTVFHFYDKPNAVSVLVDGGMALKECDTVGYVFGDRFHEEVVVGLEVNQAKVPEAREGERGAYVSSLTASDLKKGTVVYLARPRTSGE